MNSRIKYLRHHWGQFTIFDKIICVILFPLFILTFEVNHRIYLKSESNNTNKKPLRRQLEDVKAGEMIQLEWYRIKGGIGYMWCVNNDPETKKILLEIKWGNYKEMGVNEKEKLILDYNSKELRNFHLLNAIPSDTQESKDDKDDDFDIATLQKKMNEALDKEEYEIANELQKKIDKLLKKDE